MSDKKQIQKVILNHFQKKNEDEKKRKDSEAFREGAMSLNNTLAAEQKAYDDWRWQEFMKS